MKSFFFIPATNIDKINFIKSFDSDDIIIDFEDSVLEINRKELLNKAFSLNDQNLWFRIPIRNESNDNLNIDLLNSFLISGKKKFVIPKIYSKAEFDDIYTNHLSKYLDLKLILLIEHPRLIVELVQILQSQHADIIAGIGIGSHDLMNYIKAEHNEEQLYFPRINVLYLAKAYNKISIDIASMNISNKQLFNEELKFGIKNGFDAKFLIHPNQLKWLNSFDELKNKHIQWAKQIMAALPSDFKGKEVEPFILNGEVIEKPHVEKAQAILKKYKDEK